MDNLQILKVQNNDLLTLPPELAEGKKKEKKEKSTSIYYLRKLLYCNFYCNLIVRYKIVG